MILSPYAVFVLYIFIQCISRYLVIWYRNRYFFGLAMNTCYSEETKLLSRLMDQIRPSEALNSETAQIRGNASRSGADAKKFIFRARIRAQWQIYRFQPSPSSSTGRILKAESASQRPPHAPTSQCARQIAPRLFTLHVCNLFISFPTLSYRSTLFRFHRRPLCPLSLLLPNHYSLLYFDFPNTW